MPIKTVTIGLFLAALFAFCAQASERSAKVAIIIDDIGYNHRLLKRLLAMPFPLAFSVLPEAPLTQQCVRSITAHNKELLLHVPMQGSTHTAQEKTVLTRTMNRYEFLLALKALLRSFKGYVGINNHQGSVLTQSQPHMNWLMAHVYARDDIFFIDSRTTHLSKAYQTAVDFGVPAARRMVFLDHDRSAHAVNHQIDVLIGTAKKYGNAIAIGHPTSNTIHALRMRLPEFKRHGVHIVPVSSLVQ